MPIQAEPPAESGVRGSRREAEAAQQLASEAKVWPTWGDVCNFCRAQGYTERRTEVIRYLKRLPDHQTSGVAVSPARVAETIPPRMWGLVWQHQLRLAGESEFWKGLGGEPVLFAAAHVLQPAEITPAREQPEGRSGAPVAFHATFDRHASATPPGPGDNLPRELSSFVGRQEHSAQVIRRLQSSGLLSLVGVGGVGKTRLALRVASTIRQNYAGGAWLVRLASLVDPAQVPAAVLATLGLRERPGWPALESLVASLQHVQLLLVLDNCEHLVQACAELVTTLLQRCPDVSVLATSREPLRVPGEVVVAVPLLSLPRPDQEADELAGSEAVQLFVERCRQRDPAFRLTPEAAVMVARICRLLDGLPLGIELAAARMASMTLQEIVSQMEDDPLGLLTVGPRSAPARQRTLTAAIDWSYDLLDEDEQQLLRRLSIFSGGCLLDAVEAVCVAGDASGRPIADRLEQLIRQSLLQAVQDQGQTRFYLLETIRHYALTRLIGAGEMDALRERHRDWCLSLVAGVAAESFDAGLVRRMRRERDNLRSALRWSIEAAHVAASARLAVGLAPMWLVTGSFAEGRAWLTSVLRLPVPQPPPPELSHAASWAAAMAFNEGDFSGAESLANEALELAHACGDEYAVILAQYELGWVVCHRGQLVRARGLLESAFNHVRHTGSPLEPITAVCLATTCFELGDRTRTAELVRHGLAAMPSSARPRSGLLVRQAMLAAAEDDYADAERLAAESLAEDRANADQPGMIDSLRSLATFAIEQGDHKRAAGALAEALELAAAHGTRLRIARVLETLVCLFAETHPQAAVRLDVAADELRRSLDVVRWPSEQRHLERSLQIVQQHLGKEAYAAARAAARTATLEATLNEARGLTHRALTGSSRSVDQSSSVALSQREREVAALVTRGLSNREIADELVVTRKTAEAHISHILNKLGLSSRVQIATWGLRRGLGSPEDNRPSLAHDPDAGASLHLSPHLHRAGRGPQLLGHAARNP
jgi:non-specific serine/threonine protein kinase